MHRLSQRGAQACTPQSMATLTCSIAQCRTVLGFAPRSGHDVTSLDINLNLDFQEAQVGCEALDLEAVIWLRTAA
jgi:hypothetical protein